MTGKGMALAPKILFTSAEAAHMLSMHVETLFETVRAGHLRAIRKGRRLLFHRDELERFALKDTPPVWLPKRGGKQLRRHSSATAA